MYWRLAGLVREPWVGWVGAVAFRATSLRRREGMDIRLMNQPVVISPKGHIKEYAHPPRSGTFTCFTVSGVGSTYISQARVGMGARSAACAITIVRSCGPEYHDVYQYSIMM